MSEETERMNLAYNAYAAAYGNDAAIDWLRGRMKTTAPTPTFPVVATRSERAAAGGYARAAQLSAARLSAIGRMGGRPRNRTFAEITQAALASRRTRPAR